MLWAMRGLRMVSLALRYKNHCSAADMAGIVWWEDVCEDALTSKGLNTQLRVIGGGARNATDKIFQDNSLGGKFNITGFYAETFGTFYQSCGNCLNQAKRNVTIQNVIAINGTRMGIVSAFPQISLGPECLPNGRSTPTMVTSIVLRTLRSWVLHVWLTRRLATTSRLSHTPWAQVLMRSTRCTTRPVIALPNSTVQLQTSTFQRTLTHGSQSFGLRTRVVVVWM